MDVASVFILIGTALAPVALAVGLHLFTRKFARWDKLNYWIQQVIIGVLFAGVTMLCFAFGVKYGDCKYDPSIVINGQYGAASGVPMIAAIIFGWPAGLISGFGGGLFRLFITPFGSGDYLRAAECVTVLLSGAAGGLFRKSLFDNKKPKWGYGIILGLLIETLHSVLIFLTGMNQRNVYYAYEAIQQCDIPCAIAVTSSITLTLLIISIIEHERLLPNFHDRTISSKVQKWMTGSFLIALAGASILTYIACSTQSSVDTHQQLLNAARDVVYELETAPYGSVNGWTCTDRSTEKIKDKYGNEHYYYNPVQIEGQEEQNNNELRSIAYTRRIGRQGYIAITGGDTVIWEGSPYFNDNAQPGEEPLNAVIKPGMIYSTSADLNQYVGKQFKYQSARKVDEEFKPALTETFRLNLEGVHINLPVEHKASPMFEAQLVPALEKDAKPVKVVAVRAVAQVTAKDNTTVTQEFYVDAILNLDEARMSMGLSLRISIYIELLVFVAIYGVIYTFIKRAVVSNIHKINSSLHQITGGDLSTRVNVRSNTEFASLSDDINTTVDSLKHYIDEANKRIDAELAFAKEIQYSALTNIFPITDEYDLCALMDTAKEVGGDFYDFYLIDPKRLLISICDVSGKGIPAAMFMMRSKTLIKAYTSNPELKLNEAIMRVNNDLCANNQAMMFVTGWFGILHLDTGELEFCNAGHNPPLIKQNGKFNYLKMPAGLVLAGMEDIPYKLNTIKLEPNDEIFLYTDGVTEATSKQIQLYGEERLLTLVNNAHYNSAKTLINIVKQDVDLFQSGVDQADDITMLAVRYRPKATFAQKTVTIRPRLDDIPTAINFVNEALVISKVDKKNIALIDVSLDEILSNVVIGTYHFKDGLIKVSFEIKSDMCTITIVDNGKEANPIENISKAKQGIEITEANIPTLGLLLVKKTMNSVQYQYKDQKNVLVVRKNIRHGE